MAHNGFFSVGRDSFIAACAIGINEAAAFLVLARGSGSDNVTTRWSAEATAKRVGVRWSTANKALSNLINAGLVVGTKGSTRPVYKIANTGDQIWLPNAVVDGAADEMPPVARLRQTQDPMALRLFVELYGEQNLREDGGVSSSVVRELYERERRGQWGKYVVWRFHSPGKSMTWGCPANNGQHRKITSAEKKEGKNEAVDYFHRLGLIESVGLIEWVPYLIDGPDGEPIHPLLWNSAIEIERELWSACHEAAFRCLNERQGDALRETNDYAAAVPRHIEHVQLRSIVRLRYRPHTSLTGAWWADHETKCREYIDGYNRLASEGDSGSYGAGAA